MRPVAHNTRINETKVINARVARMSNMQAPAAKQSLLAKIINFFN